MGMCQPRGMTTPEVRWVAAAADIRAAEAEPLAREGEAVLMDEEPEVPFFERILGGVMSKMKGKAA